MRLQRSALMAAVMALASCVPAGSALRLPAEVATHADGRAPVAGLLRTLAGLREQGWILETIAQSQPAGASRALPIVALRSPSQGPAVWILSGIHGEEPAGQEPAGQEEADQPDEDGDGEDAERGGREAEPPGDSQQWIGRHH